MSSFIEFRNVSVVRDGNRILGPIDLSVDIGESFAVIGTNGSGKTTLSELISGKIRPYCGPGVDSVYRLFGLSEFDLFGYRSEVTSVSFDDERSFDDGIHVYELILTGFFGSDALYPTCKVTEEMCEEVRKIASMLCIEHILDRQFGTLSLGERKLSLIGRALVVSPKAMILDEPTSSLDPVAKSEFRRRIGRMIGSGVSVILITHDLEDIPKQIDRIIGLKDGRIAADGNRGDILVPKVMSDIYGHDVDIIDNNDSLMLRVI